MSGKGSTPRPLSISKAEYDEKFERIFGSEEEARVLRMGSGTIRLRPTGEVYRGLGDDAFLEPGEDS